MDKYEETRGSKIYTCLGSKIPKKNKNKKKQQKQKQIPKNTKYIFRLKSQHAFEKN